jgi:hypothetical protein
MQVGFVPDDEAQRLAPLLDSGAIHVASIKKIWPGRRVDVPIIEAAFYEADSGIEGCFAEKDCPAKTAIPASYPALAETVMRNPDSTPRARNTTSQGCGCTLILAIILLSSIAAVAAIR